MSKYLFEASYTAEGVRGLQQAGAASRVAAISDMCEQLGGSLDSFHFAFGDVDAFVICDLPTTRRCHRRVPWASPRRR